MKVSQKKPKSARPADSAAKKARPKKPIAGAKCEPADWRSRTLDQVRELILAADTEIVEERKWKKPSNPLGVPVWSHGGIICTGETYKSVVKLTFAQGASLKDPSRLFNASLEGNTRRAIDIHEGEQIDAAALQALIKAAVAFNGQSGKKPMSPGVPTKSVKLLSGGNPQIAKADGDAPVQDYIAAMPLGKRKIGERLDTLIVKTIPHVRKAVKWNSPFYGIEDQGWFLSFHVFTRYVKVTFFRGASLRPIPPGGTPKSKDARWIDIHEVDQLNEAQMSNWVLQAAALPGWTP